MKHAPIAIFLYNRPEHAAKVFAALKNNASAAMSEVYIFCDGPKADASQEELEYIDDVRKTAHAQNWMSEKQVFENEKNQGLAGSIVSGINKVLETHDRIIVLEDDIVLSSSALEYLNSGLNHYEDSAEVYHISAYTPPIKPDGLPASFFYNQTSCWGWATWKKAWQDFEPNAEILKNRLEKKDLVAYLNIDGAYNFLDHLERNITGELKTWAIFWQCSVIANGGYCLHPRISLARNIGADGSGQHMSKSENALSTQPISNETIEQFPETISENSLARKRIGEYFKGLQPQHSKWNQLKHGIKTGLGL